jgi:hypothetical protein
MTDPTVAELPRELEPVTSDPFLDGLGDDAAHRHGERSQMPPFEGRTFVPIRPATPTRGHRHSPPDATHHDVKEGAMSASRRR